MKIAAPTFALETIDETVVAGKTLLPDVQVTVELTTMARDPNNFENPLEYRPERWLLAERSLSEIFVPNGYLPFGGGTRVCLGRNLARLEAQVSQGHNLPSFTLSLTLCFRYSLACWGRPSILN